MVRLFKKKKASPAAEENGSPCIDICIINPESELCEGCFRTMDEIADWRNYSPEEKAEILAAIEKRKAFFEAQKKK